MKHYWNLRRKRLAEAYFFLLPWLIGVVMFAAIPLFQSFIVTFTNATYPNIFKRSFIGLDNYAVMFRGAEYFRALIEVIQSVAVDIPLIVIFSLFIALLLNQSVIGKSFFRTIYMLPILLSGVIIEYMLGGSTGATTNFFTGIGEVNFILNQWIGPNIFDRFGFIMWRTSVQILIFLAALQTIPISQYEAAQMDGATRWEMFWKITIPYIAPISLVVIIYTFIDAFIEPTNPLMTIISASILYGKQFALPITATWMYLIATYMILLIVIFLGSRIIRKIGG